MSGCIKVEETANTESGRCIHRPHRLNGKRPPGPGVGEDGGSGGMGAAH